MCVCVCVCVCVWVEGFITIGVYVLNNVEQVCVHVVGSPLLQFHLHIVVFITETGHHRQQV